MMKEFPTRYRILTYFVACTTATIDARTDMNESRTDKDTAQQNHCHHNGSPAFFDRTPLVHINVYDARYRTYDERQKSSATRERGLSTPAHAPRAAQASRSGRAALARYKPWGTESDVEALHPRHAHTRLWRLWVRNRAKERRGADTHGAR
jgi:hypothetical protein